MKAGDWVYHRTMEFKVAAVRGEFLMVDEDIGYLASACQLLAVEECPRCHEKVPEGQVHTRYSFSVYAGKFCDSCCSGYRDNCGLDQSQGSEADLDEPLEPDWA